MMFFNRRYVDLLDSAYFFFTNNIQRCKKRTHHRYQNHEYARHHKIFIVEHRIEPVGRSNFYLSFGTEAWKLYPVQSYLAVKILYDAAHISRAQAGLYSVDGVHRHK